MPAHKYHKSIPLDDLIIDPRVQRTEGVDMKRVVRMAENFAPRALGTFIVSERANGEMVCLDGAHRRAAGMKAGYSDPVDCTVFSGLTVPEEAALFLKYNDKKDPSAITRFKARVVAEDPVACHISKIVENKHGWTIGANSEVGYVAAVEKLERIYRTAANTQRAGEYPDVLDRTLQIITDAWDYQNKSVDGVILIAVGQILGRYGSEVDNKILIRKLEALSPIRILVQARALRDAQGGAVPAALARVIVGEYNKGRRANLLPDWKWTR